MDVLLSVRDGFLFESLVAFALALRVALTEVSHDGERRKKLCKAAQDDITIATASEMAPKAMTILKRTSGET